MLSCEEERSALGGVEAQEVACSGDLRQGRWDNLPNGSDPHPPTLCGGCLWLRPSGLASRRSPLDDGVHVALR